MEQSGQIFALCQIHRAFAADGGIDCRQQCGRQLNIPDAAQITAGRKASQISHHTASQSNHGIGSVKARLCQKLQNKAQFPHIFRGLTSRNDPGTDWIARSLQTAGDRFQIQRSHIGIRDQRDAAIPQNLPDQFSGMAKQSLSDQDGIRRIHRYDLV
ncbi:hypothetical protein DSECCO2_349450 [anaerobic digester metagenome]